VAKEPPEADQEIARLRAADSDQKAEIARLRGQEASASRKISRLGAEAGESERRELELHSLVERLRREALVDDDVISELHREITASDRELSDLRAIRDALTPPVQMSYPGVELAASFLPASEHVSGDFYLVAEGLRGSTVLVVGDVVGKGLEAARRAAFTRTVFATTVPFSDDPALLLSWANAALFERPEDLAFATVGCVSVSARDRVLSCAYAGHPPILRLDSGEELGGGRAPPLGLSAELACTASVHRLTTGAGVLLYTDGVTEAPRLDQTGQRRRSSGERFGQTRLAQIIRRSRGRPPSEVVAAVTTAVEEFAAQHRSDDLCLVAARFDDG
jgi:serine phosphatase RsbU (regulator of sigma subunit)